MKRLLILCFVTSVLTLGIPETAHACAVCFDANGEVRMAFILTTVFLTMLPLAVVGGTGLWLRRRHREIVKENAGFDAHAQF